MAAVHRIGQTQNCRQLRNQDRQLSPGGSKPRILGQIRLQDDLIVGIFLNVVAHDIGYNLALQMGNSDDLRIHDDLVRAFRTARDADKLAVYNRLVTSMEQRKIVQQAMRKNHMMTTTNDVNESIKAQDNINDVVELLSELRRNKEPLLHTAVFIELKATSEEKLKELQADIQMELTRSKISVDRLLLRQKEGFLSVLPTGNNVFATQFERVLPASSVANLYPLNYSGKTDENGFYIGRDKYGSNVLVDFDKRTEDKTNSNILILGNSGQGKSYLMKLLLCNQREAGKSVLVLDPEHEYEDLCSNLGGTYIDMMSGEFMINPL